MYSFSWGKQNHRKRKYFLHSSSFTFCVNLISYYYMRLCLSSNWPSKLLERKFETFLCGKHQRDKLVFTRIIIHVFICKCGMDYSLWFMIQINLTHFGKICQIFFFCRLIVESSANMQYHKGSFFFLLLYLVRVNVQHIISDIPNECCNNFEHLGKPYL